MQISGNTFIVTGASSGLGAATAEMIVQAGGNVVLADINKKDGRQQSNRLGETQSLFVETDVTSARSVEKLVSASGDRFGAINGLVSCAGVVIGEKTVGKNGPHDLDAFKRVIEINLIGTFNVIRLAAERMQENQPNADGERGVIVNTASVAAFEGQVGQAAYAASKGGVVGMTLPVARDLSRGGIRVMTIAPGIFETPMMAGMSAEVRDSLGKQVPFPPRLGRPSEFASLVAHIIANPMLNGEVIRLDGAIRMQPR